MAGGDAKWSGPTQISAKSTLTKAQRGLAGGLLGYTAQNLFGTPSAPGGTLAQPNVYPGARVAGVSPLQEQAFGLGAIAPARAGAASANAQSIMNQLARPTEALFGPVAEAAANTFQNRIAPVVMENFAGLGAADSGGARQALARAGGDVVTQLGSQLAQMMLQGQGIQAGALPAIQGWANQPFQQASDLAVLGGQQRGIGQEFLTAEQEKWMEAQPWSNPMLQLALRMLPQTGQQMENIVYKDTGFSTAMKERLNPFG